jgi:hypothetical protein
MKRESQLIREVLTSIKNFVSDPMVVDPPKMALATSSRLSFNGNAKSFIANSRRDNPSRRLI